MGTRANKMERGEGDKTNKHKEDLMSQKGEYGTSYMCVRAGVYEPQHKTDGRQRVGERNRGDRGVGQSESNGEDIRVIVADKVTKEHTNKKAQVGKRFHEGGRL